MKKTFYCSLPCLLLLVFGCGKGEVERPVEVFPVSGHITYGGKPVANADVTFFNEAASRSAFGRTDTEGFYRLTTFAPNDGAAAGKHIVTVQKYEVAEPTEPVADIESTDYVPPTANASTNPVKPKTTLPEKYASQSTTTLVAVVESSGENVVDLKLE